ncbi:response regulator transcription factor [Nonomuraea sp. 10N515B]|uniref:response regulator transcription factor n=1 Tax=Nonomuraea sp. 10N515B TaxID=3457422 RepID=UPI003FCCE014
MAAAADAAAAVEHADSGSLFPRYQLLCLLAVAQGDPERADLLLDRALADPALLGRPRSAKDGLTEREHDVLRLIAKGLSNRQIAARLHISPSTAGVHVSHILTKLGAATRTEATAIAFREGLAGPSPA